MIKPSKKPKLKRFYKDVSIARAEAGWQVLLDGKPMRTPARNLLVVPGEKLAQGIAEEWARQGEEVELDSMQVTQFSCAALDYVENFRDDVVEETVAYGDTDVLCYRADAGSELAGRQDVAWNPLVAWAEAHFGSPFQTRDNVMPFAQDPKSLALLKAAVEALPLFELTALWLMTKLSGSLLLPFMVFEKRMSAAEAFAFSRLEETWQNEHWGEDDEARSAREAAAREMDAVGAFLALVRA